MEELKRLVRHIDSRVRILTWLCVLLFVCLVAMQVQLQLRNQDINTMRDAVADTRDVAAKASDDLSAAITRAQSGESVDTTRVVAALDEIHQVLVLLQNLDAYVRNTIGG